MVIDSLLRTQTKLLRESWRQNDGAEGETVHAVCAAVEELLLEREKLVARVRELEQFIRDTPVAVYGP